MSQSTSHENLSTADDVKVGSERSFGIVFAVVFLIISLFPLWSGEPVRLGALGIAAAFLGFAFIYPKALKPLNLVWFKFGLLLHKIVSPLVMGLIFFGTVFPISMIMRLLGKRPLDLDFDTSASSYWIERTPPSPEPGSMKRQF